MLILLEVARHKVRAVFSLFAYVAVTVLSMPGSQSAKGEVPGDPHAGPTASRPLEQAPRIPSRFEPCLPETCGTSGGWQFVSIGSQHRILIGNSRVGILSPKAKGSGAEMAVLEFAGAGSSAIAVPGRVLLSKANYFEGRDRRQWHTNVPEYDGVTLHDLYPGIDVRFYYQGPRVEFDVQAGPNTDLSAVRIRANKSVHILGDGDVELGEGDAAIAIHIPAAYQLDKDRHRIPVKTAFNLLDERTLGLKTGSLRAGLPTVVDPTIAFSKLLAQSAETSVYPDDVILSNVAVDGSGNTWVAGTAYGPLPNPSTNSQLDCSVSCANGDYVGVAFAAKFDASGNLLVSDLLGLTVDNTVGMTLDSQGNVYLDGDTEYGLNYPTTSGAFDTGATPYGLYKVFVSKIDSTGGNLVFSTLLGSTSGQTGSTSLIPDNNVGNAAPQSIAVDSQGNVYVGGATYAGDFPVTANALKSTCGGSPCPVWEGFITEFNPTGSALVYSTLFGGSGSGTHVSQLLLASGKIIVSGLTQDTDFPVSASAIHRTIGSCALAGPQQSDFLASIDPTKSGSASLIFSTFICEEIQSMALDSSNNIYLGVMTPAGTNNTPPTPGSFVTLQPNTACTTCSVPVLYPGIGVEEISADGSQVLKMSYLDVSQHSALDSVAVDASSNVYVSGHLWVSTAGAPIVNGVQAYLGTASECNDSTWKSQNSTTPACSGLFVMKLDAQMDAPIFATVYGPQHGSAIDNNGVLPSWLAVDSRGNIYDAGWESLISWPTGTFQNGGNGTQEGYLLKITGVPANPGVLLTSDHLFFPSCTNEPPTYSCAAVNNYNQSETQTVTIVNHSGATIDISSIKGDGTTTDPLSASQSCVGSLNDGSACSITVSFTPQTPGNLTGTVTITDSSSASPHVITGIGTGWMGEGQPASNSVTFATTGVGQSSAAQSLFFTNAGNLALNVSGIAVTGDFSETDNCSGGINPGSSCAISLTFKPTAAGTRTGTLTIGDDGAGSPHVINLTGTGAGPAAALAPSSLTFASQATGTTSAAQKITLTNSGSSALSITSVTVSGDFAETQNCGSSVNAGASCTISVTFTPTAAGTRSGTLTIADNASGSPQTVALTGTGVSSSSVMVSPTSLTFASQTQGTTSPAQTVTLTNSVGSALSITSITASGDFAETNTCGSSVASGASCSISVAFTPTATGTRTGGLTIADSASGSPQTVSLTGTGAARAGVTLSPTSLTFASQAQGTTSAAQAVTLTNSGGSLLNLTSIAASGDFAETNSCGSSLVAGASCTISVKFTPTAAGTRTGTLTVADSASGSPQTISLSGTGVSSAPVVTLSSSTLTFAAQNTGSTSAAQTLTLTNSGSAALSLTSIAASGDFSETNTCGASVAAAANCTISVTFTPTAGGPRTGTLTITDSSSASPQTVALVGTGSTVAEVPATSSLTIGSAGGSVTDSINLSPAGGFTGTVSLACKVAYTGTGTGTDAPTCSLNPTQANVTSNSTANTTLTISTTAASARNANSFLPVGGGVVAVAFLFFGVPRKYWRGWRLLIVLGLAISGMSLGCGGGGGAGGGSNPQANPGTSTGNYSVTVTASSGTMQSSVSISLVVQ